MRAAEVLDFWFGSPRADASVALDPRWFGKDAAFDAEIRSRFGTLIADACAGRLDGWSDAPETALACVIVLDQFTRNAGRDTPQAFAGDARALALARHIVASGWDLGYGAVQRWFCYLPFEHSESLTDQDESVRLFGLLRDDPVAAGAYEWAVRHREVIVRFGRFPHRNAILGRASTADESEFLKQPGSRF
ncbi:MAG TPA: DUF924 family protein [Quisquiliibacterium sp.]|nr:DUF924 family protein [Quisquiliibacterium sp.]